MQDQLLVSIMLVFVTGQIVLVTLNVAVARNCGIKEVEVLKRTSVPYA